MALLTQIKQRLRRITGIPARRRRPHASIRAVTNVNELGIAAAALSRYGANGFGETLRRLRDLYDLATPALHIQVTGSATATRLILAPWDRRQVSMSVRGWHLLAGAEATSGSEAFVVPRGLRTPMLYSTAPDHPLFVIVLDRIDEQELRGFFPPYVTHVTIVVNGREVVSASPLSREHGARVFSFDGRAA